MAVVRQTEAKVPTSPSATKSAPTAEKKSGLRTLEPGEVLFHEGDAASSLYIIQKGQLRLYRPKGKGFIELALLRAGEVLGEMAYFAEDPSESRRSCSASAIVRTEVIEISFVAFGKTMSNLNPWFKTIINTLASRLRKANSKIKELESNSVAVGYGGNAAGYQFFKSIDLIRIITTLYLVLKAQGEQGPEGYKIHKNSLKFYSSDIYNLQEVKFEELVNLLLKLNLLKMGMDKDNLPNVYIAPDINSLKLIFNFLTNQRTATDDKKIRISDKCEIFLEKILLQIGEKKAGQGKVEVDLNPILSEFKERNIPVNLEDLKQAKDSGFVSEVIVGEGNRLTCSVDHDKLKSNILPIKFTNAVEKINESKARQ